MTIVYTTFANVREAKKIGNALVRNKLAACVNFFSIGSVYRWKGKVTTGREVAALIKTEDRLYGKVEAFLKKHHSFDTPAIFEIDVDRISKKYAAWIRAALK